MKKVLKLAYEITYYSVNDKDRKPYTATQHGNNILDALTTFWKEQLNADEVITAIKQVNTTSLSNTNTKPLKGDPIPQESYQGKPDLPRLHNIIDALAAVALPAIGFIWSLIAFVGPIYTL